MGRAGRPLVRGALWIVTTKKSAVIMHRTPAFVSREVGAAELCVSPATWDRWVADGKLPAPFPTFPGGLPRWRWQDVEQFLTGAEIVSQAEAPTMDPFIASAGNFRNVTPKDKHRG